MKYYKSRRGFTLAEVLITLGIIGIVAAMTIPTLIAKYRVKSLESGFKKSYSTLMQALIPLQNEFYGSMTDTINNAGETAFFDALWKGGRISFSDISNFGHDGIYMILKYKDSDGNNLIKDYAGNTLEQAPGCPQVPRHILADGSAIGGRYNCFANGISIDVNGSGGPNAIGHDIFYFGINNNTKRLVPLGEGTYSFWNYADHDTYCSKNSTDVQNGVGCTAWALKNVCPDDETKTYWECLEE